MAAKQDWGHARRRTVFGSTLNSHLDFHCVVIDGGFESADGVGAIVYCAVQPIAPATTRIGGAKGAPGAGRGQEGRPPSGRQGEGLYPKGRRLRSLRAKQPR